MAERKRLGQRLIEKDLIDERELRAALGRQEESGELLGQILVQMGALEPGELQATLAEVFDIEKVAADSIEPDPQALELVPREVAERLAVFPLGLEDNSLRVMTPEPLDGDLRDELQRRTGRFVETAWGSEELVRGSISRHYGKGEALRKAEARIGQLVEASLRQVRQREGGEAELSEAAPVVDLIDELIRLAVRRRASDLHIEPRENRLETRIRVDGLLRDGPDLPKELQSVVTTRVKIVGNMDISESRLPQDGRAVMEIEGETLDMRLSSFPVVHGESLVIRLLQEERLVRGLEELGMTEGQLDLYRRQVSKPHGILLVTGPTGSGKTTTLYSTLVELGSSEDNIMTIEDPVEYELEGIRQSQVNVRAGLTFASGLRSILRQDPDVILVGEIRDADTMEIAVRSALTGHLVFSTLHTNDAPGAIPRLVNMGAEPYLLSSSIVGVLAQRLIRLLCPHCREPGTLSQAERRELRRLGVEVTEERARSVHRAPGCYECDDTGYLGRIGIFEFLEMSPRIRELILEGADAGQIRRAAEDEGMSTMLEQGLARVFQGQTSVEEVLRVAV